MSTERVAKKGKASGSTGAKATLCAPQLSKEEGEPQRRRARFPRSLAACTSSSTKRAAPRTPCQKKPSTSKLRKKTNSFRDSTPNLSPLPAAARTQQGLFFSFRKQVQQHTPFPGFFCLLSFFLCLFFPRNKFSAKLSLVRCL